MLPGRSRNKGRVPALSASRAQGLHPAPGGGSGGARQRRARTHLGSSVPRAWRLFLLLQGERIRFTHVAMFSISLSFCPTFWEISSTFSTKISVERLVVLLQLGKTFLLPGTASCFMDARASLITAEMNCSTFKVFFLLPAWSPFPSAPGSRFFSVFFLYVAGFLKYMTGHSGSRHLEE